MNVASLIIQALDLDRELNRFIRQQPLQAWMQLNVTIPQLKTLFFVSNQKGTNLRQLSVALRVTPSNATGIVDRLVEQGLLIREEDTKDRRRLVLTTTDRGETILNDLRERRTSALREALSGMPRKELDWLVRGLSALVRSVREQEENNNEHDRGL